MAEIRKCSIVSGAPDADIDFIKNNIDLSSFIICADSGYKVLDKAKIRYNAIVADFDSSEKPIASNFEIIEFPVEKDATDTFNAVKTAVQRGYNHITIYNALGGRFDHSYSNILCLDYCRKNGVYCEIKDSQNRISLIEGKRVFKRDYQSFSLFAFLEKCYNVRISGAYYTAGFYGKESFDLEPCDQFAQSNYVTDDECVISLDKGTLLLIESND